MNRNSKTSLAEAFMRGVSVAVWKKAYFRPSDTESCGPRDTVCYVSLSVLRGLLGEAKDSPFDSSNSWLASLTLQ